MTEHEKDLGGLPESPERRALLAKAGRFAAATPAAVLVLLATAKDADAGGIFKSGGGHTHKKRYRKRKWKRWHKRWHKRKMKKRW